MSKRTGENIFLVLFLVVAIAIFYGSATMKIYGTEPFNGSHYGQLISGLLILTVAVRICSNFIKKPQEKEAKKVAIGNPVGLLIVFAISVIYCFGITKIGYFTSTFVFVFVMITTLADNRTFKRVLIYCLGSLAFCVLLYFMFDLMQVYMPVTPLI